LRIRAILYKILLYPLGESNPCSRTENLQTNSKIPEKNAVFPKVAASGIAVKSADAVSDPNLALIINTWPSLPDAIRAGIMAMVKHTGGNA
jgi:hypothetical protein